MIQSCSNRYVYKGMFKTVCGNQSQRYTNVHNVYVSTKCTAPVRQLIITLHAKQLNLSVGTLLVDTTLHSQQMVNYLAVPACLSLRSKLAACLPVVKVSTGCLPTIKSVVRAAHFGLVRHSGPLDKSLTQQEAFVSNFCLEGLGVLSVRRAEHFAVMQLAVEFMRSQPSHPCFCMCLPLIDRLHLWTCQARPAVSVEQCQRYF